MIIIACIEPHKIGEITFFHTDSKADAIDPQPCLIKREASLGEYLENQERYPSWYARQLLKDRGCKWFYEVLTD